MEKDSQKPDENLPVNIVLGKETDKEFSKLLRSALRPAANEFGQFFGDLWGIAADWARKARERNAEIVFKKANKILNDKNIDINETKIPAPEEFHSLIEGMSLAGDSEIQNLWAGLFAGALDPKSSVTADPSLVSALRSLNAMDARVLKLIAYLEVEEQKLIQKQNELHVRDFPSRDEFLAQSRRAFQQIKLSAVFMAIEFGITNDPDVDYVENLFRLGIIDKVRLHPLRNSNTDRMLSGGKIFRSGDPMTILKEVMRDIKSISSQVNSRRPHLFKSFSLAENQGGEMILNVKLTKFGIKLATACEIYS